MSRKQDAIKKRHLYEKIFRDAYDRGGIAEMEAAKALCLKDNPADVIWINVAHDNMRRLV